jgi:GNAT superfamily N-acetyltransferase
MCGHDVLDAIPPAEGLACWPQFVSSYSRRLPEGSHDRPVGIVSYSFLWPAEGLTRSLYLKEVCVAESARRRGVGTALMNALFELAAKHECRRVA